MKLFLSLIFGVLLTKTSSFRLDGRIAHGNQAIPHSAPYIVSIQVSDGKQTHHSCGGSILDKNIILTAGHCLSDSMEIPEMAIYAGRHNIRIASEPTQQKRKILNYTIHKEYAGGVAPFDVALIYVDKPFEWTDSVKPVALARNDMEYSEISTLFGWGLLSGTENKLAVELQTADIPLISHKQCRSLLKISNGEKYFDPTNLCTVADDGSSACSSDSGGPLVQFNEKFQETEIIGVVSWGPPCGEPKKSVTVYVGVELLNDWITSTRKELAKN